MFATTGIIQGNTVLSDDILLGKYSGRKAVITVLDEPNRGGQFSTASDEKLFALSDSLISQNLEAYRELAK